MTYSFIKLPSGKYKLVKNTKGKEPQKVDYNVVTPKPAENVVPYLGEV